MSGRDKLELELGMNPKPIHLSTLWSTVLNKDRLTIFQKHFQIPVHEELYFAALGDLFQP